MGSGRLVLALVTEAFTGPDAAERLLRRLRQARELGATLALLPELPLNRWAPATKQRRADDAEPPGGPRQRAQAAAAREARIGLVGGAIVTEATGERYNTALVFDAAGRAVAAYRKLHLPEEDGFWETSHYRPGSEPPSVVRAFDVALGLQICSDVNRPALGLALAAAGAEAILAPRATPRETYARWKLVLQAAAVTSAAWVVSTNRPGSEPGVTIGGPSIAIDPHGDVVLETEDPLGTVTLDREAVTRARAEYPGYLDVRADIYSRAWGEVASGRARGGDDSA